MVAEGTGRNHMLPVTVLQERQNIRPFKLIRRRYIVSLWLLPGKPRVCVLVILDHPQNEMHLRSGGILAAPIAGKLTEEILKYLQVERDYTEKDKLEMTQEVFVPNVVGLTAAAAEEN